MNEVQSEGSIGSSFRPESDQSFRMAQLLIVVAATAEAGTPLDLERLAVTDFLAANPFVALDDASTAAERLRLQGFGNRPVSAASPGQRFASRRERMFGDVARLVAVGLVRLRVSDGRRQVEITQLGAQVEPRFQSVYADAYRSSCDLIVPLVFKLSDAALYRRLGEWLRADPFFFDLLGAEAVSNEYWTDNLLGDSRRPI